MTFALDSEIVGMTTKYCPVCQRFIAPDNINEVASGEHDGFIYVHDNINHDDADIAALEAGMQ